MIDPIARARAVLERAASAPWSADGRDDATHRGMVVLVDGADQIVGTVSGNDPYEHAFADGDIDSIVLSRNVMPALLRLLSALEQQRTRWHDSDYQDSIGEELDAAFDGALTALREALEGIGA